MNVDVQLSYLSYFRILNLKQINLIKLTIKQFKELYSYDFS